VVKKLDSYKVECEGIVVDVVIQFEKGSFVPDYEVSVLSISESTNLILEKIRQKFVNEVRIGKVEFKAYEGTKAVKEKFRKDIKGLIQKFFPGISEGELKVLLSYIVMQDLGLGHIEILLKDANLEEIVVNGAKEPVWVYHKKHGWCKSNVKLQNEERIRHYSTMIGKDIGKQITILQPLMDAHLLTGDRVNATLNPISSFGNTITIRKFAEKPWTITDFLKAGTISYEGAAFIWLAMQNELSILIAGGTGSGKTSMMNCICNFLPPNQRIISIEDTRELQLPSSLHWVPMETRLANPEGKGEVSMLDLVVNSLRMRPDRILVGEIRRKREAEVLFEAMHTGHSVYATIHANNAEEAVARLTNPPIDIPKMLLPALSLVVVQNRNRRTGKRRTLQIAEILDSGDPNILMQLDIQNDSLKMHKKSVSVMKTLNLFTGMKWEEMEADIQEKVVILKDLVSRNINDVHKIGEVMAKYYIDAKKEV
jgi:archaeal flagellar protein FlaI